MEVRVVRQPWRGEGRRWGSMTGNGGDASDNVTELKSEQRRG